MSQNTNNTSCLAPRLPGAGGRRTTGAPEAATGTGANDGCRPERRIVHEGAAEEDTAEAMAAAKRKLSKGPGTILVDMRLSRREWLLMRFADYVAQARFWLFKAKEEGSLTCCIQNARYYGSEARCMYNEAISLRKEGQAV